ncbi:hypothetical protein D0B54_23755 [Solimonas sp. K1W22B-7]|uniref:hypothetical protein n=1 Tax=Solimonas sp. K1W22B-7 TaxID=2303331 RepID=UPI000E330C2E|nr:hypothetical protein [Solimonas sp. K1W22B-7]AXQ31514.1 hypothetical protein D0B54_23755 [Solimonas sp. K1W22B-7]
MKFIDTAVCRELRFSIGCEEDSGRCYLSIPVSNRLVDYEKYYLITGEMHDAYPANADELQHFAEQCRCRVNDALLLVKPGKDRSGG